MAVKSHIHELLTRANAHLEAERWADAAHAFEQALAAQPGSAQDWYRYGVACAETNQAARAIECYCRALSIDPSHARAWNNLGVCRQQLGDQAQAADAFARAVTADPSLLPAILNLAHAVLAAGDESRAASLLEQATSLDPGNWATWDTLARVRLRLGRAEAAEQAYRKAMELAAPQVLPHIQKAEAAMAAGEYAAVETALAAALEFIPDHPVLRHMLDAVRGQTSDRPPEAYVRALFDDFAETYDESMRTKLQYTAPERLADLITPMLEGRTTLRIVDLGCGTGFMGDALAHLGAEITGVDLSEKMLAKAAQRGRYARLIKGDVVAELQQMPAGAFQAIVATDLLIYLGDLQPLFAAARRALAQDGLFAVSVESLEQGTFQLRPSGRYAQSRAYLQALARQNGLTERAFQTFNLRFERDRYIEGGLACFALQRPIAISAPARRSSR